MIKHDVEAELRKRGYRFKYFHRRFQGTQVKSLDEYEVEETGEGFYVLIRWNKSANGTKISIRSLLVQIPVTPNYSEFYTLKR